MDIKNSKMTKIKLLGITMVMFLTGCSSMSVEQCHTAQWFSVGEVDGSSGHVSRIDRYFKACQKAGIQPNQQLYQQGYQRGLSYYCTAENIFDQALKGSGSYSVCPLEKRSQLKPYYDVASDYYHAKKQQDDLLDNLERYRTALLDDKISPENRDKYRKLIQELRIKQDRVEFNYYEADRKLERFKRQNGL